MVMKRLFVIWMILALLLPCAAAAQEEKVLNLFTWEMYVDDQTIADFEAATGIKVRYSPFEDNEEMLLKLQMSGGAGQYDVIIASDYAVNMARKSGLLQKIDKSMVTNYDLLDQALLSPYFDPDNEYSVPYMSGVTLIVYDPTAVTAEITGYKSLWDESLRDSLVVMDDARNIVGIALKALGQSFNVTDDETLALAARKLEALGPNIRSFNSTSPDVDMVSGECAIGYMYGQYAFYALEQNPDLKVVYPEEGLGFGLDSLVIPAGAPHPENANLFINFLLQPEIAAQVAVAQGFRTPVPAAKEFLDESYLNNPVINIPSELLANHEFIMDLGENESKFQNIWTQFKLNR